MSEAEQLHALRLFRSENVGPITYRRLIAQFGSAEAALEALPTLARKGGAKKTRIFSKEEAEAEIAALQKLGARLLVLGSSDYPSPLAALEDAPPVIAAGLNPHLLKQPMVAVVGARNASLNGKKLAETISRDLGEAGIVVVSGLARGIDTAAHEAALPRGTVAVVAGGIDVIYPPENAALQNSIFQSGCIVSEMPPGMQPTQRLFPRRNRIISGLAAGVLVVEASPHSGSLITANLALEQGREIFAVPGSPLDPRAQGTNGLIRSGAHLTERAEDILEIIKTMNQPLSEPLPGEIFPAGQPLPSESELEKARAAVLECLSPTPAKVDELIRDCHFSPALVSTVLLELELAGRVERHPGNQVSLLG
jgi:DNA processing protein